MMSTLARASIDGGIVVAIVWVVARVFRLSPAARTALWWCAAAKFVVALIWVSPVLVPILPPVERIAAPPVATAITAREPIADSAAAIGGPRIRASNALDRWSATIVGFWMAGCVAAAVIGLRRVEKMKRIVARSSLAPPPIQDMAERLAVRLKLRRTPQIRMSDGVTTPLVVGVLKPVVLLPIQSFDRLGESQQLMVLCHELAHVKRGDLWFGCTPALAERVFFFHPLAHLAAREYSLWREAACDAAVLDALDAAPRDYGRLLLDLGVARRRTGLAAAGAPWSFPNLKRRIVMLQDPSMRPKGSRFLSAAMVSLAAFAIVPLQLAARPAAGPGEQSKSVETNVEKHDEAEQRDGKPKPPQSREELTRERIRELEREIERFKERERARSDSERPIEFTRDDVRFVAFFSDDQTTSSGSDEDRARARRYRRGSDPMIWFMLDGREYVVRDRETIDRVQAAWKPVYEIGDLQGVIGGEQGKLGEKQGEIGALLGTLGARQGELGALQAKLAEEQVRLAEREARAMTDAAREALERDHRGMEREIDARAKKLHDEMRELNARMRELDEPIRKLNEPMEELARKMSTLSGQMEEESHRARIETRRIFERAIANGSAEIVK
jgi:beta-lactamase regulating signal transducer with metallopeptidase domain